MRWISYEKFVWLLVVRGLIIFFADWMCKELITKPLCVICTFSLMKKYQKIKTVDKLAKFCLFRGKIPKQQRLPLAYRLDSRYFLSTPFSKFLTLFV